MLNNNVNIKFRGESFNGLKLASTNNRKESNRYYDELTGDKNDVNNRIAYKNFLKIEALESVHMYLSRSFMSEGLSYLVFVLSLISLYECSTNVFGICMLIFSLLCLFGKFYFVRKAKNEHTSISMLDDMVDFIFDMK